MPTKYIYNDVYIYGDPDMVKPQTLDFKIIQQTVYDGISNAI